MIQCSNANNHTHADIYGVHVYETKRVCRSMKQQKYIVCTCKLLGNVRMYICTSHCHVPWIQCCTVLDSFGYALITLRPS